MKYAFIFGTSIFLSEQRTVSYADSDERIEFLKILSHYNHWDSKPDELLTIDANIASSDDDRISILGNQPQMGANIHIKSSNNQIVLHREGHHEPLLDVHQLEDGDIHGLSSHIVNEIEAQNPVAVFRIRGDFKVGNHRIIIDNEKLFVDGDDYANGVTNAHDGVLLTPYDVLS